MGELQKHRNVKKGRESTGEHKNNVVQEHGNKEREGKFEERGQAGTRAGGNARRRECAPISANSMGFITRNLMKYVQIK